MVAKQLIEVRELTLGTECISLSAKVVTKRKKRKKRRKVCLKFQNSGTCRFGSECKFLHEREGKSTESEIPVADRDKKHQEASLKIQWACKLENKRYVPYGFSDDGSDISHKIEAAFMRRWYPERDCKFSINGQHYEIDFESMVEVNRAYKTARKIRRYETSARLKADDDEWTDSGTLIGTGCVMYKVHDRNGAPTMLLCLTLHNSLAI